MLSALQLDGTGRAFEAGKLNRSWQVETVADDSQTKNRLVITDRESRMAFLIDTGAVISVIPSNRRRHPAPTDFKLYAANGTVINTFGNKTITLSLGLRRQFPWRFVVADVGKAIIGADFLRHYNLLVDLNKRHLIDPTTTLYRSGTLTKSEMPTVSTINSNNQFQTLLKEFPTVTLPQNLGLKKLEVYHYITTHGPPVAERARRLPPDKLQVAKKEFQHMLNEGIT
ncbi:uncharacterized protein LOC123988187 [Osmia bicornis bicornis]|uniref:uncharacterized protein LOC123988187 n=1 Tax=Osmia bicornis bicornis TaxID=1437191 RepID=UPI001EAF1256|nr:uncharacterized protein LOC123988187 [Osmia bicornis bicornis]